VSPRARCPLGQRIAVAVWVERSMRKSAMQRQERESKSNQPRSRSPRKKAVSCAAKGKEGNSRGDAMLLHLFYPLTWLSAGLAPFVGDYGPLEGVG
jgi:hypothetical protein